MGRVGMRDHEEVRLSLKAEKEATKNHPAARLNKYRNGSWISSTQEAPHAAISLMNVQGYVFLTTVSIYAQTDGDQKKTWTPTSFYCTVTQCYCSGDNPDRNFDREEEM